MYDFLVKNLRQIVDPLLISEAKKRDLRFR